MSALTRRCLLTAGALGAAGLALPASAAAPMAKMQGPGAYRYKLGHYQLTALYDGIWYLPIASSCQRSGSSIGERVKMRSAECFSS